MPQPLACRPSLAFHQVIYSPSSFSCTSCFGDVFITSFAKGKELENAKGKEHENAKDNNSNKIFKKKKNRRYLLIILYQLSKFEAASCNSFLRYQVFYVQIAKGNY